jgi:tetratricopeptide (TPR) repeat protein
MRPKRVLPSLASTVALGALLVACGGHVRRGATLYADGRYIEAAEVFERTEHRLTQVSTRERAEYGLYRGMTLLVLGDLRNAHRWLTYAYQIERYDPGSLTNERRALLDRGFYELGQRVREQPPHVTQPTGSALAAQQPTDSAPPPVAAPPPAERRSLVPQ